MRTKTKNTNHAGTRPKASSSPVYLAMVKSPDQKQSLSLPLPLPPDMTWLRAPNNHSSSASSASSVLTDGNTSATSSSVTASSTVATGATKAAKPAKAAKASAAKKSSTAKGGGAKKAAGPSKPAPGRKSVAPAPPVLSDKKLVKLAKAQQREEMKTKHDPDAPTSPRKALRSMNNANALPAKDLELAALLGLAGFRPQPRHNIALVDDKFYALSAASEREVVSL